MPIIISRFTNPYTNLSIGTYIARAIISSNIPKLLFICSSHHGVFIGRNQNLWKECDTEKMKQDSVPAVRRDTGGGACYVDRGNRLFSFFELNRKAQIKKYYPVLLNALNTLDLKGEIAQMQGSNDIVVAGKKVSGSAFTFHGNVSRHHGTILINVDKAKLSSYLTPPKIKLESKGIRSVSARICNITEINPGITHEEFDDALIKSFQHETHLFDKNIITLDEYNFHEVIVNTTLYNEIYDEYTSDDFIYNKSPPFTHKMEHRFTFGIIEILLVCSNNKIESCEIFSDSLDLNFINSLKKVFINKSYRHESIDLIQHELGSELGCENDKIFEFCDYLRTQFPASLQIKTSEEKPSYASPGSIRKFF